MGYVTWNILFVSYVISLILHFFKGFQAKLLPVLQILSSFLLWGNGYFFKLVLIPFAPLAGPVQVLLDLCWLLSSSKSRSLNEESFTWMVSVFCCLQSVMLLSIGAGWALDASCWNCHRPLCRKNKEEVTFPDPKNSTRELLSLIRASNAVQSLDRIGRVGMKHLLKNVLCVLKESSSWWWLLCVSLQGVTPCSLPSFLCDSAASAAIAALHAKL
jgi:hypothetical protein